MCYFIRVVRVAFEPANIEKGDNMGSFTNKGRQFEVDLIKFLAIPFMVCIHFYEQFGAFDYKSGLSDALFRNVMEFIGGPLAAPVFMFSMGIGMIYTGRNTPEDFMRRGAKLLLTGYSLNFVRQTLPQLIGLAMGIDSGIDITGGLLCVDILPFAGMAFLSVGLMRKLKLSSVQICLTAFLLQSVGIHFVRIHMEPGVIQNLLGLLVPTGEWTSFPLTLWLVYPSLGMVFGEYLMKCEDKAKAYRRIMIYSAVFFISLTSGLLYTGYDVRMIYALCGDSYYHQNLISTLWITPIIMAVLSACYFLFAKAEKNRTGMFISYCSINLNTIYIIQWLIIAYSVAIGILTGLEKTRSPLIIFSGGITVTILSIMISIPFSMMRKRKPGKINIGQCKV